jgi:hypothetical protein
MAEVREAPVSASPEDMLRAAYPRRLQRARAVRWLSFIAWRSPGREPFGWWQVPLWLDRGGLLWPRRLVTTALVWVGFGLALGAYNGGEIGLTSGFALGIGAGWLSGKLGSRLDHKLFALVPRLPRTGGEALELVVGVATGVLLRRVLVRQWRTEIVGGTPGGAYRACLRSALIDAAACLVAGLPLAAAAWLGGWPSLLVPAGLVTGLSAVGALCGEPLPEVWLAGVAKPPHRQRWNFLLRLGNSRRLLRAAERGGLVRASGNEYLWASAEIRDYLIGREQAAVAANAARADERKRSRALARERSAARGERYAQAAASAAAGPRTWLLGLLSPTARRRLSISLSIGIVSGFWTWFFSQPPSAGIWTLVVGLAVLGSWTAVIGVFVVRALLARLAGLLRWSLWLAGRMSPQARVGVAAAIVGTAGLITLLPGPAAVRHGLAVAGTAVLPGAVVAVVGGWGAALVHQRLRDSTRLPVRRVPLLWRARAIRDAALAPWIVDALAAGRRARPIRNAALVPWIADALAAGVACVTVLLWSDPALLGAQAAAALLFPLAVWLSVRAWRIMSASERVPVRAAADITVSLLLGASLTGLLVCLANLLKMPPAEVSLLKGAADRVGGLLDVPWWAWAGLYAALAALSVASVRWPGLTRRLGAWAARRLRVRGGWLTWQRVVPGAEVAQRGTAGAHIGLLLITLIGAVAPAAAEPVLRVRLASQYTETLTDVARSEGATAELRAVAAELPLLPASALVPLAGLVSDIHRDGKATGGQPFASGVELDVADRLGELQAQTLPAGQSPPPVEQFEADATRDAGLDSPAGNPGEVGERLGELGSEERDDQAARERADRAGELAASALAKALGPIPGLGSGEVVGILKEYLSALIEFRPLKDTFAAWTEKLGKDAEPPTAASLVVPDPARLDAAAVAQARQEVANSPVSDPARLKSLIDEGGVAGAVALANQTRYLQENATGPCDGCARPDSGSGSSGGDHPDEPPVDPVP